MSSMVSSTGASWKIQTSLDPGFVYCMRFEVLMTEYSEYGGHLRCDVMQSDRGVPLFQKHSSGLKIKTLHS